MKKSIRFTLLLFILTVFSTPAYAAETLPSLLNAKDIYEKCSSAVFFIETFDMQGNSYGNGSGFIISNTGLAVTNLHVLNGAFSATATLSDSKELTVQNVLGYSEAADLAVIQLNGSKLPFLNVGDSAKTKGGEKIYTIGSPMGLSNTISEGIISNPNRMVNETNYMQISAPISHGSSGGALINEKGQAIGVTTAGYVEGQNLNFAVPINPVKTILNGKNPSISLKELTEKVTMSEYAAIPQAFESFDYEAEPNDSSEMAQFIENGTSMVGAIDKKTADYYFAACNIPGTVYVYCFGDGKELDGATLTLEAGANKQKVTGDAYTLSSGETAIGVAMDVAIPDYAEILLQRKDGKTMPDIGYVFYYEFVPKAAE